MKNFTDEKTLLREIKNGNGEAFEFLFNSYYPRLRGYAARFVTDEEAVREMYDYYDFSLNISEDDIDGFQKTADFMLESGMIDEALDVNSLFIK